MTPDPSLRLLGPDLTRLPRLLGREELDAGQQLALARVRAGTDLITHGPPGSGRTTLALSAVAAAGPRGLLLSPRRPAATRLREGLAAAGAGDPSVMTPAALGFAVLRAEALGQGRGEPTLVTGAEQDSLLGELIAAREHWHLDVEPAARTLPGFRSELRDLITRATELGLTPARLEELGRDRSRPAWQDAAAILRDYLGVLDLESAAALDAGPRLDSGALVRRAASLLAQNAASRPADLVVVDDAQDLTAAGLSLVAALATAGAQVLILSCPDAAVDTFRGALPDAADRLREQLPRRAEETVLDGAHSSTAEITACVDSLRGRLPLAGAPPSTRQARIEAGSRRAAPPAGPGRAGIAVLGATDPLDEARMIGAALRDLHHRLDVPYDDMAVVCRSGGAVSDVADLLARTGLPVRIPRRPQPLREEPVVADLLTIVEIGIRADEEGSEIDPLLATELLQGPFGDADTLRLRRIRRLLLAAHRDTAHPDTAHPDTAPQQLLPSEQLLSRALLGQDMPGLPPAGDRDRAAAPVHRLRAMIAAATQHRDAEADQVIWQVWEASGLAGGWRRAALGAPGDVDGARARLAGGRLDALMELFAAAERLTDRRPGAGALDLVEQIRSQAVVEDTLAPAAAARGSVAVLTPAQLAGEHRDTVVLARLQEGTWPDLRLRSTLLGAAELALVAGLREGGQLPTDIDSLRAIQRRQVVADELRLAVSALARARTRVLVTAVDGEDLAPSALHEVIAAVSTARWTREETLREDPGPAPDARRLVAALRRRLREPDPASSGDAALALARLARAGAPGADPARWYHQDASSTAPLHEAGTAIALSPSALERADACPQAWLMERAGGTRSGGPAQLIGTALHRLAQQHPAGPVGGVDDLLEQLHALLRTVPGMDTWSGRRRVRTAEDAARMLADHLTAAGQPLAVEAPFEVELGRVRLRGSIDRIEGDASGLRVVDLKTGKLAKSARAAEEDLQLAAYQAAVREGALDQQLGEDAGQRLNGAQLVYVGTPTRRPSVRTQTALPRAEDPAWFDAVVDRVAGEVSGSRVAARVNSHCSRCAVRAACALQPEGVQL